MGALRTIARRTFLIGSVAVGGGVAFGAYLVGRPHDNPLTAKLGDGDASFNPWVLVSTEKVTLIAPHADMGQGVLSSQALLIAEEMDLSWGDFEVSFGEPSPAYWNHGMADDAVPFRSTDRGLVAEGMRTAMTNVIKVLGMQGTGGSTSMPDSFVKLREAGAMARETLKLAAATRTGIPVAELKTENGAVILPDGETLRYTELAADAAALDPVRGTPLRDPSQWRLIGTSQPRLDMVDKCTGTTTYGIDVSVEGMVFATVRVNPYKGGGVEAADLSAARDMPGVLDILDITNGIAVIATNTWYAIQAANALDITWADGPYPPEQADHWAALSESFDPGMMDREWRNDGDIDGALAADSVIEAEYRSPYVAHAPLEPLNAVVRVTDSSAEIWTGHQVPGFLIQQVAEVAGLSTDQVTFHNQYIGGSFGHRLEFMHIRQAVEIARQMPGTPVKMTYSREEDFAHDFPRHISMGRASGVVANGQVKAMDLNIAAPSVLGSQMSRMGLSVPGPDPQIAAGSWNQPYKLENFRMCAFRAAELAPVSSWRAVGAPGAGFFFESFLDELIHAAGADPLEERIRLADNPVARGVLEAVGDMSSWGGELAPNQGRGVAMVESFGVPVAEVVEVTMTDRGIRMDQVWVAADVGTVIDPLNFQNLVQGGVVFGLGHAINSEITYSSGVADQVNYYDAEGLRLYQCPDIHVRGLENNSKIRGIGEPPVPPAAPALANAIFAATGERIREMPFHLFMDFV